MSETTPPEGDYTESGVPSFDFVRDRIENRYATSLGSTELAGETPEASAFEEKMADRDRAAKDKLEEIRRSMRGE
jgi:phage shock protein A